MRLVFLGTPAFAVPTLEAMCAGGHEVAAVVTQPDRPRGRGQNAAASPVKEAALRLGLAVYQPERVRRPEAVEYLRGIAPRCDGGGGLRADHSAGRDRSGAARHHQCARARCCRSIAARRRFSGRSCDGETRTGVTTMRIDAGLDTGDMLLKAETEIGPEETAVELGAAAGGDGRGPAGGDAGGPGGGQRSSRKSRMTRRPRWRRC